MHHNEQDRLSPPLRGRGGEGGHSTTEVGFILTPLPSPPPQAGREWTAAAQDDASGSV
jgi:hypothetical protein